MRFLNHDSSFMILLRNLVDYVTVGLLWMIFSIPVFTSGAAFTAALLTVEIAIHREEGKILNTFWKWFRSEFKEATLLWGIQFPLMTIVTCGVGIALGSKIITMIKVMIYLTNGLVLCWTQLWFGYLSNFEDRITTVLGNTFRMVMGSIGWTLLLGLLSVLHIVAAFVLLFLMPPLLILIPGSYLIFYGYMVRKIFGKYLPKEEPEKEQESVLAEV